MARKIHADHTAASREWNRRNPEKHQAMNKRIKVRIAAAINAHKNVPCADCGGTFPTVCMDFDHRPGERKLFNVSRAVTLKPPIAVVLAEIAKCDLVCANCHRLRSQARNWHVNDVREEPVDEPQLALEVA